MSRSKNTLIKEAKLRKLDLFLLLFFPVFATVFSFAFTTNYFVSTVLFFVLPAVYYSIRTPKAIKKVTLFTLFMFVPIGVMSDFIFEAGNAWTIPHSVFNFRVFGVIPIENFFWGIGASYLCLMLYEHFIDKSSVKLNVKKTYFLGLLVLIVFILFLLVIQKSPTSLLFPYPYLWIGCGVLLLPTLAFLAVFPKIWYKFFKICAYMFCLATLNEFTALSLGHWAFTSPTYIGIMPFFGFSIPVEEFLFYFIIMSLAIMSYFEFFFDNSK